MSACTTVDNTIGASLTEPGDVGLSDVPSDSKDIEVTKFDSKDGNPSSVDVQIDGSMPCEGPLGCFGDPCENNDECESGLCISPC